MTEKGKEKKKFKSFKYEYETNAMSLEWWQKNVIYHIYLPSYKDNNNDGIGDFDGLMSKLSYLEDLGVKSLLLSPFYPSPGKDNGYDVSSYITIDPIYGTMDDFDQLMKELKSRDMNVIVDLIANHTSDQHEWFKESVKKVHPYTDYYVWVDKSSESTDEKILPPTNWLSVFGGSAWTWNEDRKQFYYHQFLKEQPDLNYRNPAVKEEIKKVITFWLEKGVDGFRIDAASHLFEDQKLLDEPAARKSKAKKDEYEYLDHIYTKGLSENLELLKEFRAVLNDYENKTRKSKIMITEVNEEIEDVMRYYGTIGDKIADFPFNFKLHNIKSTSTGEEVFEMITTWLNHMPKGKYPNWQLSSHDHWRVVSRTGKRLALAMEIIIMLLPGIPLWYYGDELGMENTDIKLEDTKDTFALRTNVKNSRDPSRTPMQWNSDKNAGFSNYEKLWLPLNNNYKTVNVYVEKEDPLSFLNIFKYLIKLRNEPSILCGTLEFPIVNKEIFSFLRFLVNTKCFLIILNMNSSSICVKLSNISPLIPKEGILEFSNRHIILEESKDITTDEKNDECKCKHREISMSNLSAVSSQSDLTKVSLSNVHLKPKEAVVISFIGQEQT